LVLGPPDLKRSGKDFLLHTLLNYHNSIRVANDEVPWGYSRIPY